MSANLVAIGDSLSQGMISGSIYKTETSYPALIARCLGATPTQTTATQSANQPTYRMPDFSGEGGLPVNLESVLRLLVRRYGEKVNWAEVIPAALSVRSLLDRVEDYWERGEGNEASLTGPLHHHLAVFGFRLEDCDTLTEAFCRQSIPEPKDNLISQIPEFARYRATRRSLNPQFRREYQHLTQLDAARAIARNEGGIENLIFWLGANNCLSTVLQLKMQWSSDADLTKPSHQVTANLWRPEHFQKLMSRIAPKIDAVKAQNVFVATIPHITIPPVSRGITPGSSGAAALSEDGYYEYYTHFWVWDEDFAKSPDRYSFLRREEARQIDQTVDNYNAILRAEAQERGWTVVDTCKMLDDLAFRRQVGNTRYQFPAEMLQALKKNPATQNRRSPEGDIVPDTRFLRIVPGERPQHYGGIFGLDGFHPTTTAYGLIADAFLKAMKEKGVAIARPLDWDAIVAADTLLVDPPDNLIHLRDTLGFLYHRTPLARLIKSTLGT